MKSGAEMILSFFKGEYENKNTTQEDIENLAKAGTLTEEEKNEILATTQP